MTGRTRIRGDWLVLPDGTLVEDGEVLVDAAGTVVAAGAGHRDAATDQAPGAVRLAGRALLPGCVNAHSHVFQRLLRGRVQRATGADDSFWTWRSQMYDVAARLTPDELYDAARFGYYEMLRAGFTAVGEFHYLHHAPGGRPYDEPNELALAVLRAAQDVGIRIVLLDVFYERGGREAELDDVQRRFADASPAAWLERVDALAAGARDVPLCAGVGPAPHSLRAVTREGVDAAVRWADDAGAPLHLHVSEQPAENDAVRAEHGCTPVELLDELGALGPRFTAVHATHVTGHDVRLLGGSASNVCVCPTTERDLGDGVTPAVALADAGVTLAVGSDSHALIDPFEEARAVELDERLVTGRRVIHRDGSGRSGPRLLTWLSAGGTRSLGLPAPLEPGSPADLVALDLGHAALRGWTPDSLIDHIAYAASPAAVTDVFVGGRHVVAEQRHPDDDDIMGRFDALARRLWS